MEEQNNFEGQQPVKRRKRSFMDTIFMAVVMTLVMMLLGQLAGDFGIGVVVGIVMLITGNIDAASDVNYYLMQLDPAIITGIQYIGFIGIWIVAMLIIAIPKRTRPIVYAVGTATKGNNVRMLLLGLLIGGGMNALCILAAWLNGDIEMYYDSFRPFALIAVFIAVFIQSSAEELLCRGYLYQKIRKTYKSPWIAIIGNSLLFAALHLFNEGVTVLSLVNIAAVGILFSLMVYYLDSLWCAMAAHAMWNFTQNIIFGLPNSGIVTPFSILKLDAASARDSFAYNVGFGVEGTVLACAVLIAASVLLYLWGKKHPQASINVWQIQK